MALCSLSIGSNSPPPDCIACINKSPDITSASLFASSTLLPALAAAKAGTKPAAPTMAAITVSQFDCVTAVTIASGPYSTSVAIFLSLRIALRRAAPSASATTAMAGLNSRHCSAKRSTCLPAVSATTLKRSGCERITSKVFTPIDPVEPRIATRLKGIRLILQAMQRSALPVSMHQRDPKRRRGLAINGYYLSRQRSALIGIQINHRRC